MNKLYHDDDNDQGGVVYSCRGVTAAEKHIRVLRGTEISKNRKKNALLAL